MADSSKVIIVLSVCIGLFFLLVGTLKFTPIVVKDLYFDAVRNFILLNYSYLFLIFNYFYLDTYLLIDKSNKFLTIFILSA